MNELIIGNTYRVKTNCNCFTTTHKKIITYSGKLTHINNRIVVFDTGKYKNSERLKDFNKGWSCYEI